ncbi:MAG: serine protease, partial [Sphingobium sp.]|nr:serine protease [Sphingobium sp.]
MKLTHPWMIAGMMLIAPSATHAQLLPGGGGGLGAVGQAVPDIMDQLGGAVDAADLDRLSP